MKEVFSLRTVRKKILMLSKLAGLALIFSYVLSTGLPISGDVSFLLWLGFVLLLVLGIDFFYEPLYHETNVQTERLRKAHGRTGFFRSLRPCFNR